MVFLTSPSRVIFLYSPLEFAFLLAYFEERKGAKMAFTYYPTVSEYQGNKNLQIIVQKNGFSGGKRAAVSQFDEIVNVWGGPCACNGYML